MAKFIEAKKTTFTDYDFLKELSLAWKNLTQKDLQEQQAKLVWAKYSHETGGGEHTWNYNIGNIKFQGGFLGKADGYTMLHSVWEINAEGQKVFFNPPSSQTWFRAYYELSSAICDYLDLLNNNQYKKAFNALVQGNLELYAKELHDEGYYTDTIVNYTAGLKRWANEFPTATWNKVISDTTKTSSGSVVIPTVEIVGDSPSPNDGYQQIDNHLQQINNKVGYFTSIAITVVNALMTVYNLVKKYFTK